VHDWESPSRSESPSCACVLRIRPIEHPGM
jgi:hypothetical protein